MRGAYYNEIEPFAAQWLRNLIAAKKIAPGDVDERSITDIRPDDVKGYTQCHFFAGIAGWSLALRIAGWDDDRPVWTGSCPCQPFSNAGKGLGTADARHLWPQFRRLIAKCGPAVVLGEQVASNAGRVWLAAVRADLEELGYAVGAADLCAAGVGAPHIRQRLWWVADAAEPGRRAQPVGDAREDRRATQEPRRLCDAGGVGNACDEGLPSRECEGVEGPGRREEGRAVEQSSCPSAGYWRRVEWLPCRDGKARPTRPGVQPLLDGLSTSLGRLRAIETAALAEIETHEHASGRDTDKKLRMVLDAVRARASGEGTAIGVCQQLSSPEVLLNFLLCLEATRNGSPERSGFEKTSQEIRRGVLRGVWNGRTHRRASCERQPDGQHADEHADALRELSFVLARAAEAHREAARNANAASGRVGQLRAAGNAIVPQAAAAFIDAVMASMP